MTDRWQIEIGQVWRGSCGGRFVVESNPNEFNRFDIRDEKTNARTRVHVEFFNGKKLVESLALIPSGERQHA